MGKLNTRTTRRAGLAAAAGLLGSDVRPACEQAAPGITDKEIKLGGVFADIPTAVIADSEGIPIGMAAWSSTRSIGSHSRL